MRAREPWVIVVTAVTVVLAACSSASDVVSDSAARPRPATSETSAAAAAEPPATSAVRRTTTTSSTTTTSTTEVSTTTTTAPDPGCDLAAQVINSLGEVRAIEGAAEQLGAISATINLVRPELPTVGPASRELVEQIVFAVEWFRDSAVTARESAAATGDVGVQLLTDQLVVLVNRTIFNPLGFLEGFDTAPCPGLRDLGSVADLTAPDLTPDIRATRDELVARGHGAIAEAFVPPGLLDLTDRDMTVALSGRQAEYDRCAIDPTAAAYGDNPGCDALHDACDARDLLACNDLYWVSIPRTAYEEFAATCGGRVPIGSEASAGFCEELD